MQYIKHIFFGDFAVSEQKKVCPKKFIFVPNNFYPNCCLFEWFQTF